MASKCSTGREFLIGTSLSSRSQERTSPLTVEAARGQCLHLSKIRAYGKALNYLANRDHVGLFVAWRQTGVERETQRSGSLAWAKRTTRKVKWALLAQIARWCKRMGTWKNASHLHHLSATSIRNLQLLQTLVYAAGYLNIRQAGFVDKLRH